MMTHEEAQALLAATGLVEAAHNDLAAVQTLLNANPALIQAMNALHPKDGEETPQRAAAHCRKIDILKFFLAQGVQPDLFMAVALGSVPAVNAYLLSHPEEVDAKGAHGIALMVHANDPAMVQALLERGADPTVALTQLAWSGRVDLMQVALAHGADVNLPKVGRRRSTSPPPRGTGTPLNSSSATARKSWPARGRGLGKQDPPRPRPHERTHRRRRSPPPPRRQMGSRTPPPPARPRNPSPAPPRLRPRRLSRPPLARTRRHTLPVPENGLLPSAATPARTTNHDPTPRFPLVSPAACGNMKTGLGKLQGESWRCPPDP